MDDAGSYRADNNRNRNVYLERDEVSRFDSIAEGGTPSLEILLQYHLFLNRIRDVSSNQGEGFDFRLYAITLYIHI